MPRRKNRNALRMLALAACAGLGMYHNTADDTLSGGGGGEKKPPEKKADEPAKLTVTKDEFDALVSSKVEAAVKAEREKTETAAKKRQEDDERKAAEEQGKFKELADKHKERADALDADNRRLKRDATLSAHLAEKHPDYLTCAKYIAPLIPDDTDADALAKAVETAATQYVTDNPREKKGGAGAPAKQPVTGNRQQGGNGSGNHAEPVRQRVGVADSF